MTWLIGGNSNVTTTSFLGTTNLQPLVIKTNNKEAMRVASADGDVSIGELGATRDPNYKLDVQGILNADDIYKDGTQLVGSQWANVSSGISYAAGNVGVGKASGSGYRLDVVGTINATEFRKNGAPLEGSQWENAAGGIIYDGGNVGIGRTPAANYKLDVAGTLKATGYGEKAAEASGVESYAAGSGTGHKYGVSAYASGVGTGYKYGVYAGASGDGHIFGGFFSAYPESRDTTSSYSTYGLEVLAAGDTTGYKIGVDASVWGGGVKYGGIFSASTDTGDSPTYGLYGRASGDSTGPKYGVLGGASGSGVLYAGFFEGDVYVSGRLTEGGGGLLIDHPLDADNKTLRHNFVESPENLCLYRGKTKLDGDGSATIQMPDYFAALTNESEATVYLTPIGEEPSPASYKWRDRHTAITVFGTPRSEVAYLVLAERDDPTIHHLSRPVEEEKGNGNFERGKLLNPQAFGEPPERGFAAHLLPEKPAHVESILPPKGAPAEEPSPPEFPPSGLPEKP